ncbi:MAG TPA: DUF5777 family beta-barrel protein [Vicinamibacterales bacterium]|nr:DUF5777 family beta-barrel protein [Vicinamibacterales bacterium]
MSSLKYVFALSIVFAAAHPVAAQSEAPPPPPAAASATQGSQPDPDLQIVVEEPDFALAALPTTLRMPARKFAFRLTHRFSRPIAEGDVGDFFADFFGFDSSAQIGLELRYGIRPGTQATVHRTNERTIQFLGQHALLRQSEDRRLTVDALGAIEGADNFSEDFSGSIGAVLSHRFADRGAIYAQPIVVFNSNFETSPADEDEYTMFIGVGARWRIHGRVYLFAELAPRVAGFDDGGDQMSFGIEKRAGGHVFQFNVSNGLGTTLRQVARGGPGYDDWFVGFNLSRRFF